MTKRLDWYCVLPVIALAVSLTACLVLPVPQTSDRAVDNTKLDALIGASKTTVIDEIGTPTHQLSGVKSDYLVYRGYLDSTGVIFMLWIPVGIDTLEQDTLNCLRLEFKEGVLQRYDFRTRSMTYYDPRRLPDCRRVFWTPEELGTLISTDREPSVSSDELLFRAEGGDAEAQLQLYHAHAAEPSSLVWLCRSADQNHPYAQAELGRIYHMGLFWKSNDLRWAYVWYGLAIKNKPGSWGHEYLTVKSGLSPEQLRDAEAMLVDWAPGQCERELVPDALRN